MPSTTTIDSVSHCKHLIVRTRPHCGQLSATPLQQPLRLSKLALYQQGCRAFRAIIIINHRSYTSFLAAVMAWRIRGQGKRRNEDVRSYTCMRSARHAWLLDKLLVYHRPQSAEIILRDPHITFHAHLRFWCTTKLHLALSKY